MDKVAAIYLADAKKAGKDIKPAATPAVRRPRAVRLHAAVAEAAGGRGCAFAAGQGGFAAEHQHPRSCTAPAKKS